MTAVNLALVIVLAMSIGRVFLGPTVADRLLAVQLASTTVIAVLLVLAFQQGEPALQHVALVLALLAAALIAALVQGLRGQSDD